jgi:glycosyltransferase involved in cell wall biosynthesis
MRIGLLIDSLIGGGAERVVLNFAQQFAALGHDVHVILVRNEIEHRVEAAGYRIHALSEHGVLSRNRALNKLLLARALARRVRDIEADGRRFDFFISNAEDADRLSRLARLPNVFVRYRNSMLKYLENKLGSKTGLKRAIRRWRWRRKFRRWYDGRHLIAVSEALREELVGTMGLKPRSIVTIYNPFDFERLRRLAAEAAPVPAAPFIVYAAKFENRKRQDVLVRAFARLSIPHRLVLIGGAYTDSDRAWLAQLRKLVDELGLSERVLLPGFQHNPYPWIARAALFALSSDSEGLPTVLIESLILGTPVVSTDCPTGPREILSGELAPFLCPPGDDVALSARIAEALLSYPAIDPRRLERFRAGTVARRYLEHCGNIVSAAR